MVTNSDKQNTFRFKKIYFVFAIYLHYILLSIIKFLQLRWHLLTFRLKEANLVRNGDKHYTELGEVLKCPLATLLLISYLEHTTAIFKERKAVSLDTCFDVVSLTFTTWKYQNSRSQSSLHNELLNNVCKNFIRSFIKPFVMKKHQLHPRKLPFETLAVEYIFGKVTIILKVDLFEYSLLLAVFYL